MLEGMTAQLGDADLYLCLSRLEDSLEAKTALINKALGLRGVARWRSLPVAQTPYDRLFAEVEPEEECPLTVTVIVPAYNAQAMLETTLRSLRRAELDQSGKSWWPTIAATDGTARAGGGLLPARSAVAPGTRQGQFRALCGAQSRADGGARLFRHLATIPMTGRIPKRLPGRCVTCYANPSPSSPTRPSRRARMRTSLLPAGQSGFLTSSPTCPRCMFRREMVVERIGVLGLGALWRRIRNIPAGSRRAFRRCGPC